MSETTTPRKRVSIGAKLVNAAFNKIMADATEASGAATAELEADHMERMAESEERRAAAAARIAAARKRRDQAVAEQNKAAREALFHTRGGLQFLETKTGDDEVVDLLVAQQVETLIATAQTDATPEDVVDAEFVAH